jgi:hypothetical protein
MAINPSYAHADASKLAKVKLGESIYYIKDADLRAVVEAFGTATSKDYADVVTSTGTALPTQSAVYDYVYTAVGDLGAVLNLRSEATRSAVSDPRNGDVVVESDGKEWLYAGNEWREIGSEGAYVLKTTEVAGIQLSTDITSAALSTALDLKALAHKDNATTTLNDYATGINGASYTPAGDVTVTLSQTTTAATLTSEAYTPAGEVTVTLSQTTTPATLSTANYTPEGTVTVTPSTASIYQITDVGTLPSYTAPSVSETSSSFATAGVTAAIDSTDTEMLVFTTASTASALTGTGFDAGSFDAGTLPSRSSISVTTGISAAEFTGSTKTNFQVTGVSYDKASVSAASFSGTEAANMKITGASYDKASVSAASFSGTADTITPTLAKGDKTVTVS